uniref:Ig-like domain-containing protein n=1 Tax=Mola mola TaxID=94237 RepID=A0A3Q3W722_MOLML
MCSVSSLCPACCLLYSVMSQILNLEPQNSTVLKGTDARFIVTVLGKWEVMAWSIRDLLVIVIYAPSGSTVTSSDQFSATFWTAGDTSCVEFTIHNVTQSRCSLALNPPLSLSVLESGTVSITGASLSVMQDQQVEFQCITSAWYPEPIVGWRLNGVAFNSSNTTIMTDGVSFDSTSVLTFQAVSNTTVECWATVASLSIPISSSVFLVVVPKPPDWTVLIAVVSSIGGFALLVLLIIGLIFCYKRWKRKRKALNILTQIFKHVLLN